MVRRTFRLNRVYSWKPGGSRRPTPNIRWMHLKRLAMVCLLLLPAGAWADDWTMPTLQPISDASTFLPARPDPRRDQPGHFALAHGQTLLLGEIKWSGTTSPGTSALQLRSAQGKPLWTERLRLVRSTETTTSKHEH